MFKNNINDNCLVDIFYSWTIITGNCFSICFFRYFMSQNVFEIPIPRVDRWQNDSVRGGVRDIISELGPTGLYMHS